MHTVHCFLLCLGKTLLANFIVLRSSIFDKNMCYLLSSIEGFSNQITRTHSVKFKLKQTDKAALTPEHAGINLLSWKLCNNACYE